MLHQHGTRGDCSSKNPHVTTCVKLIQRLTCQIAAQGDLAQRMAQQLCILPQIQNLHSWYCHAKPMSAPQPIAQKQHRPNNNARNTGHKICHCIVGVPARQGFGDLFKRCIGRAPCKDKQNSAKDKRDQTDKA
jgi:hypothetical protein